jgi:hypothetical protein
MFYLLTINRGLTAPCRMGTSRLRGREKDTAVRAAAYSWPPCKGEGASARQPAAAVGAAQTPRTRARLPARTIRVISIHGEAKRVRFIHLQEKVVAVARCVNRIHVVRTVRRGLVDRGRHNRFVHTPGSGSQAHVTLAPRLCSYSIILALLL